MMTDATFKADVEALIAEGYDEDTAIFIVAIDRGMLLSDRSPEQDDAVDQFSAANPVS